MLKIIVQNEQGDHVCDTELYALEKADHDTDQDLLDELMYILDRRFVQVPIDDSGID